MRYPLIDGQGNFGSVDGDPPAAMRYTEARLTPMAEAMMADLDKDTVDFVPNYDETTEEPTVLPTHVPEPARQRLRRHRRRHGDQHPAAQPARGDRRRASRVIEQRGQPRDVRPRADAASSRARLPDRRLHRRPRRASTTPTRPAAASITVRAQVDDRGIEEGRQDVDRHHRDPLPGQQEARCIENIAELRREKTLEGISDLRDESRPRRHADRHRAEARRGAGSRPEQPLQAHAAADDVRHHHAGDRRRPAEGAARCSRSSSTSSSSAARWSAAGPSSSCARPRRAPTSSKASRSRSITSTR